MTGNPRTFARVPARTTGRRYHLYLVGLGIRGAAQVTLETEAVLRRCTRVYYIHDDPAVAAYLRDVCPRVFNAGGTTPRADRSGGRTRPSSPRSRAVPFDGRRWPSPSTATRSYMSSSRTGS